MAGGPSAPRLRRVTFGPLAESATAVPFETTSPLLTVLVHVDGQPMRLLVDTGAGVLTLFEDRRRRRLATRPWRVRPIHSMMAPSLVREVVLSRVRLGETEWTHRPAFLMEAPAFPCDNLDGILAASPLGLKRLGFDFQRNVLSWEK